MPQLALADASIEFERRGITAVELLALRPGSREFLSASSLEAWLLDEGLAEESGAGLLVPTKLAFVVGEGLDFLS